MSPNASDINLICFVIEGILDQLMKDKDGGVTTIGEVLGNSYSMPTYPDTSNEVALMTSRVGGCGLDLRISNSVAPSCNSVES